MPGLCPVLIWRISWAKPTCLVPAIGSVVLMLGYLLASLSNGMILPAGFCWG